MTTQAIPDPINLKSWEEAFQYPLPTVKKLSVRLRKDIDDHRNRLRSLVGASYRDLLGTAERIMDMNGQIQTVEADLNDIGRRCNSRILERGDNNYTRLERVWAGRDGEDLKLNHAARSRILNAALGVVERLVKKNGNTLQSAKLMVLSRLMYKSLEVEDSEHISLERQRRRIAILRNRLLGHIDRVLAQSTLTADVATSTLSAFALLSSSKLRDVLAHFLAVRTSQLESMTDATNAQTMLDALRLYTESIRLVQEVFPKRVTESLAGLGKTALLLDQHVAGVAELNLDVYGQWIADDVRSFRPWVQQETFSGEEARKAVSIFNTSSRATLLGILQHCLQDTGDANVVLEIRKSVLGAYLSVGSQSKIDGFLDHLQEMRESFVQRLEQLASDAANAEDLSLAQESIHPTPTVWSLADDDFDLTSGGISLRTAILRRRHGYDERCDKALAPLQRWLERVSAFSQNLTAMRAAHWEEHTELDLEEAEEEMAKDFQGKLSVDDPARVEQRLKSTVDETLASAVAQVEVASASPDFLLRVLRGVNRHAALARALLKSTEPASTQEKLVQKLHGSLAQAATDKSIAAFQQALSTAQYVPIDLWDGSPKLPLQVLPITFRFVKDLQNDMACYNEDVWSSSAVSRLKDVVASKLAIMLQEMPPAAYAKADESANNADETEVLTTTSDEATSDEPITSDMLHERLIQRLFDATVLSHIFAAASLKPAVDSLIERADLSSDERQRLEKNALEYWRRTYLLFGMLAPSESSVAKR